MNALMGLVGFVVTLSLLVVVHEWGHYAVARLCGVRVLAFSLGFGQVLAKRTDRRGCEWRLSAIPFGGYVKMLNTEERDSYREAGLSFTEEEYRDAFDKKSVWKRFAVVFAGPAMNLILAIAIYAGIAMVGTWQPTARLGVPVGASQAAEAGIVPGDLVVSVAGKPVSTLNDLRLRLLSHLGEKSFPIEISREGSRTVIADFDLSAMRGETEEDPFEHLGFSPFVKSIVAVRVLPGSPAEAAGLKAGDEILSVAGREAEGVSSLITMIRGAAGREIEFRVRRQDGSEETIVMVPRPELLETGETGGRIGASLAGMPDIVLVREGPFSAVASGTVQVWEFVSMTVKSIARMVTGQMSVRSLSGPIAIGDMAGQTMQIGPLTYLLFLAMISVSLGVINLLPVPVLDGGHLMYYSYEIIVRRPPSRRAVELGQRAGIAFVLLLSVFAIGNDLLRFFA